MNRIFISQFLNHTKYEISNFSYKIQIYCKMYPYMKNICQPMLHGRSFHMQIINAKICQFDPFGIIVHTPSGGICMHNLRPNQESNLWPCNSSVAL